MLKKQHLLNIFACAFLLIFLIFVFSNINSSNVEKTNFVEKKLIQKYPSKISGIAKITDGDSVEINGEKIRLLGIDAPEYLQKCFNEKQQPYNCGHISYQFLFDLANNKNIDCFYAQKDIYNRYLAYCFLEEVSISNEILKNGMAVIYSFKYASDEEIKLEKQAQKQKLGIWRGAFELPKDFRKRTKN
jgi:endonuclease YncB( thermonuclease family)